MFKALILLLLTAVFPVYANDAGCPGCAGEQLKALLAPVHSMTAAFEQVLSNEQGKVLQKTAGNMILRKPAQFRWEIVGKSPRLVVSDGKKVWDFDQELEQVTVQKLDKGAAKAPIFFLTGNVDSLTQDFDIRKSAADENADTYFELIPKKSEGSFQSIKLGFKNKILSNMTVLDQLGQRSLFLFKNVLINPAVSEQAFHFTPPKGVDVLNND